MVEAPYVRTVDPDLPYLAAPDRERAAAFEAAWCDPSTAAVICARGGYGVQRLVDRLDWDAIAAAGPKPLVGFSDVTALHQAFAARLGWSTVHGPVVISLGAGDDASRQHLHDLLLAPEQAMSLTPDPLRPLLPGPRGGTEAAGDAGPVTGVLAGGNVALLAAGLGTRDHLPAAGAVVVLEDVGEELYRLDRIVTQLRRAGWFDQVAAVVLGEFTGCGDPSAVEALLAERLEGIGAPVLAGAPVGHGARNLAFGVGVPATLDPAAGTLALRLPALA